MDRRIDLTLNGDFSQWRQNVIVPNYFDELVEDVYNSRIMSETEYEKLVQYENIFGRKRHFTEAIDAFMKSDEEYRNDYTKHCWRCGKEHRIPWKITGDLCEECEEKMSRKKTFGDLFSLR